MEKRAIAIKFINIVCVLGRLGEKNSETSYLTKWRKMALEVRKKNSEIRRGYRENLWRQTITFYYDYMHVCGGKKYLYHTPYKYCKNWLGIIHL